MAIYVFLHDTYADWEIGYLLPELARDKRDVVTFGLGSGSLRSLGGLQVTPDVSFSSIDRKSVEALILPGGLHWRTFANDDLAEFVRDMNAHGKAVAAICGATGYLAQIGLLDHVQHTSNALAFLKGKAPHYRGEALYQNKLAVSDQGVVTASALGAVDFTYELLKIFGIYTLAGCETWFRAFKYGEEPSEAPEKPMKAESDFDKSLIEENLNKSVEQRVTAHDAALEVAREFDRARQELRQRQRSSIGKDAIR